MLKIFITSIATLTVFCCTAQNINRIIKKKEVRRIEEVLSHDSMEGRKIFTPAIEKAADFIAGKMKEVGLENFKNESGYRQEFVMVRPGETSVRVVIGDKRVSGENVLCFSPLPLISFNESSGYKVIRIKAGSDFRSIARGLLNPKENMLVLAETSFSGSFKRLSFYKNAFFPEAPNLVFVLTNDVNALQYDIHIEQKITEQKLANIVGVLPGKSKADEYVIFSGHYDHIGIGKPYEKGDSINNGANDDASGITAMLMLAKYYKKINNNERTIIFTAFTGEESGGYGSQYFSEKLNPGQVVAMFNIEMIGTDSKWGPNSAYITGYEKSDFGKILEKNLASTKFKFYPDPYTAQKLFYRSDNATLARLGVPAHAISTSKMNDEPHYHKPSDEISTLDIKNMTKVIRAIAISAQSIVSGKDTPTRIDTKDIE